jgi:hypothetical protein
MASQYYGLNRGKDEFEIDESSSTTSDDMELRVDLTKNLDKVDVLLALDKFKNQILKDNWPPA